MQVEFKGYRKTRIQRSFLQKKEEVVRKWYIIDASDKLLGRLATQVATILMGKHKPAYTPHVDCGDFVIIINAEKIRLSGKKKEKKFYQYYSGYHGGRKVVPFNVLFQKNPCKVITLAVKRMLPKTNLGRHMIKKLKVYKGQTHPHDAQKPQPLGLRW
jgi:large subunit ribosomal protein L13